MTAYVIIRDGVLKGAQATLYYDFNKNDFAAFNEKVGTCLTFHEETAKWVQATNEGSMIVKMEVTQVKS